VRRVTKSRRIVITGKGGTHHICICRKRTASQGCRLDTGVDPGPVD
jgi:hypothetical protein